MGRTTQIHRLSGETVTTRAPSLASVDGISSFCMRRVPFSSLLRRRTENTLTLDIVATTRIFPSEDSIAEVIFSSPYRANSPSEMNFMSVNTGRPSHTWIRTFPTNLCLCPSRFSCKDIGPRNRRQMLISLSQKLITSRDEGEDASCGI